LQPNPAVAARAYEDLLLDADGRTQRGALAFDLYAGAGVVTRRLREQFGNVRAVEAYPESAAALCVEPMDVAAFLAQPSARASTPTLVVANPPRAGMGPAVCTALSELGPEQVTIMSCNAQSLARDLAALDGSHALMRVRGYDTLPQTAHLELVAWLQRRPNSRP
jgi:23S rRNA (uracil1939-C5)-methyltransferase